MMFRRIRTTVFVPFAVFVLALATAGCIRMPHTATSAVADTSAIVVHNAPEGAILLVDDIAYGPATAYSGKKALRLRPGTHVVQIRSDARTIFQQEVFLGSNTTKTIQVPQQPQ